MEFINQTSNWYKSEIFEGKMSLLFGMIILMIGVAYLKWGATPYANVMIWPLLLVSLLAMASGTYLVVANQKRIPLYQAAFNENATVFMESKKKRTEDFIKGYPITQKIFIGVMLLGMAFMMFSEGAMIRAIGMGPMPLSFYVFVLDHFSEERAERYLSVIEKAITTQ